MPRRSFPRALLLLLSTSWLSFPTLAGSTDDPAPAFVDAAEESGLHFTHENGARGELYLPEIMGAGAGLVDYDGDGDLDVYLVQGQRLGPGLPPDPELRDRLFRNDLGIGPDGSPGLRFTEVTGPAGIESLGYGMGIATGDFDGNGFPDLYVTNLGRNRLFRNEGDGTFRDVTESAGADDDRWSVSASFLDHDRDGDLDLYVANYLQFTFGRHRQCQSPTGVPDYCGPQAELAEADRLLRNRGDGSFEDVGLESGIARRRGTGLGVVAADFDSDGWTDLYVANDDLPNFLWINGRDGTFTETALLAGCALSHAGEEEASMGIDVEDIDGDRDLDIFLTHLDAETNTLYENQGGAFFRDVTLASGLGPPSWSRTGFGTGFLDFDLDGALDLFVVNGAIHVIVEQIGTTELPLRQPNQLFRGRGGGRFEDVSETAGSALLESRVSRGAAFGDVDQDGDVDVVVSNNGDRAQLLLSRGPGRAGWIAVALEGVGAEPAPGTMVEIVRSDTAILRRRVHRDGSYASASDPRVVFGLGSSGARRLLVRWPDGGVRASNLPESRRYLIVRRRNPRASP